MKKSNIDLAFKATISELCISVRQNFNWWLAWSVGIDGREAYGNWPCSHFVSPHFEKGETGSSQKLYKSVVLT